MVITLFLFMMIQVCVPRVGSLPKYAFSVEYLETHILCQVAENAQESNYKYKTLNNKVFKCVFSSNSICESFSSPHFYILPVCIGLMNLNEMDIFIPPPRCYVPFFNLSSLGDPLQIIWSFMGN